MCFFSIICSKGGLCDVESYVWARFPLGKISQLESGFEGGGKGVKGGLTDTGCFSDIDG